MPRKRENLIGRKFNMLKVEDFAEDYVDKSGKHSACWKCKCECGNIIVVQGNHLKHSHTKSCGCYQKQKVSESKKTHGMKKTRIYTIWCSMISRCNTKSSGSYKNYGERGIKVCQDWLEDFVNFYNWAITNGYKDNLYLERVDNNGDYCPENCCWRTYKEQQRNKRTNHFMTYNGETKTMAEWSEITGISYGTISYRSNVLKWSDEKALGTPVKK